MNKPTILLLDNFDSFTYNLVDFFRQMGCVVKVYRNTVDPEVLAYESFDLLVLSPGPSVPRNAGNLMQVIERFYREKPILGVCLGHQALVEFFGGSLANIAPVHGKSVPIQHDGRGVFSGLEQDCMVARYHSWAAADMPSELEVTARSADGVVMAVRHKKLPIEGIQFHPESVLSMKNDAGMRMLQNVVVGRMAAGNRIFYELEMKLQAGTPLQRDMLVRFLKAVEEGQLSEDQKQILLVSLSHRLRNAPELALFVEALLSVMAPEALKIAQITVPPDVVDICGTGGSGLPRINTSTLSSLLLAHCGLKIAKHGNRAAAGRFGSFNLLEKLGMPTHFDAQLSVNQLKNNHLTFVFAPEIHPVFRHFAAVRNRIGVPTIFNALGPLVNPFQPKRQFIGTAFADLMEVIFETAIRLGKKHVIVVRGWDGLDEISLSVPTRVLEYRDGKCFDYEISAADFGLEPIDFKHFSAANPAECLDIATDMIHGAPTTEHYKLVAANAAFVYHKFVENIPLPEAYGRMEKLILAGAMGEVVNNLTISLTSEQIQVL